MELMGTFGIAGRILPQFSVLARRLLQADEPRRPQFCRGASWGNSSRTGEAFSPPARRTWRWLSRQRRQSSVARGLVALRGPARFNAFQIPIRSPVITKYKIIVNEDN